MGKFHNADASTIDNSWKVIQDIHETLGANDVTTTIKHIKAKMGLQSQEQKSSVPSDAHEQQEQSNIDSRGEIFTSDEIDEHDTEFWYEKEDPIRLRTQQRIDGLISAFIQKAKASTLMQANIDANQMTFYSEKEDNRVNRMICNLLLGCLKLFGNTSCVYGACTYQKDENIQSILQYSMNQKAQVVVPNYTVEKSMSWHQLALILTDVAQFSHRMAHQIRLEQDPNRY